jgi:hypothetical protein
LEITPRPPINATRNPGFATAGFATAGFATAGFAIDWIACVSTLFDFGARRSYKRVMAA